MLPLAPAAWGYTGTFLNIKINGEYFLEPVVESNNIVGFREYQTMDSRIFKTVLYGTSFNNGSFPQSVINGTNCEDPFVEMLNCTGWKDAGKVGLSFNYENSCSMYRINSTIYGNLVFLATSQPADPTQILSLNSAAYVSGSSTASELDMIFEGATDNKMPYTDCSF